MLKLSNIKFSYQEDTPILRDISFEVQKGETLAIVGASGCGKSTLLRIISGILPNAKKNILEGEISVGGKTSDEYRQTGKLAFMFQEATLLPHLTVKQNVALPLTIQQMSDEQKTNELIDSVGLTEYAAYLPKALSGGMKTRVALARSFITAPELLLLDEPFSALDIAWKSKLYVELERLKQQNNTTVVIVTHDVQEALLLADKVIILGKKGRILDDLEIKNNGSILQRVSHISYYNDTGSFRKQISSVQKWLLNDGIRNIMNESEVNKIFEEVKNAAGNEQRERLLNDKLISIYKYANTEKNNAILFKAFEKGTDYFKKELIWDTLAYEKIDSKKTATVLDYYFDHIEEVSSHARDTYYKQEPNKLFNTLVNYLSNDATEESEAKRAAYLLDMYASSETKKVVQYLEDVENGKIALLDYPLAKETAAKVKAKINEK